MFQSWANAYRNHSVVNMGVAAYNTFANVHNTFNAIDTLPKAFGSVFKSFSGSGSSKGKANALIIFAAIACVLAGFIIAALIVHRVAASDTQVPARATAAGQS
jgi:hypothetical protein